MYFGAPCHVSGSSSSRMTLPMSVEFHAVSDFQKATTGLLGKPFHVLPTYLFSEVFGYGLFGKCSFLELLQILHSVSFV